MVQIAWIPTQRVRKVRKRIRQDLLGHQVRSWREVGILWDIHSTSGINCLWRRLSRTLATTRRKRRRRVRNWHPGSVSAGAGKLGVVETLVGLIGRCISLLLLLTRLLSLTRLLLLTLRLLLLLLRGASCLTRSWLWLTGPKTRRATGRRWRWRSYVIRILLITFLFICDNGRF